MTTTTLSTSTGQVTSADGTTIGFRRSGHGPAVVLLHGGLQAAQSLTRLAEALSGSFELIVPDRRGRGTSRVASESGDADLAAREVDDVRALVTATGAQSVFGLSAGGLVALRAAVAIPELTRVALYEPALAVDDTFPTAWTARYDRQVAAGHLAAAFRTILVGLRVGPAAFRLPSVVVTPLLGLVMRLHRTPRGDVSVAELVTAMHHDMELVHELAGTTADYATVGADVLLLGGAKSPTYFDVTLAALAGVLPRVHRFTFSGMGHNDADNDGDPARVADLLEPFFHGRPPVPPRY
jgi:pimeloyl-ACP methyl ester carboxylesterase